MAESIKINDELGMPADQPPDYVLAEIEAELDIMNNTGVQKGRQATAEAALKLETPEVVSEPVAPSDYAIEVAELTKLGPEIALSDDQRVVVLLFHLSRLTEPGEWYKGGDKTGDEHVPAEADNQESGIIAPLSQEVNLPPKPMKSVIEYARQNRLVKTQSRRGRTTGSGKSEVFTNVCIMSLGREFLAGLPEEELKLAEAHLKRATCYGIITLWREVNHERRELGRQPYPFKSLEEIDDLGLLHKRFDELRATQREQLPLLDEKNLASLRIN